MALLKINEFGYGYAQFAIIADKVNMERSKTFLPIENHIARIREYNRAASRPEVLLERLENLRTKLEVRKSNELDES